LVGKHNAHGSNAPGNTSEQSVDADNFGKRGGGRKDRNPGNLGRIYYGKKGDEAVEYAAKVVREKTDNGFSAEDEQGGEHEVEFVGDVFVGDASGLNESAPLRREMLGEPTSRVPLPDPPSNLGQSHAPSGRLGRSEENYGDILVHNVNVSPSQNKPSRKGKSARQVGGAAVAGTVAGLVVAGPILGVAAGGAAAYTAARVDNPVGEAARRSGEAVACAGDKAKEVNDKHEITKKTATVAKSAMETARKLDEKHKIVASTKKLANGMAKRAKEIDEKHHVVEKSKDAVNKAAATARDVEEKHHISSKAKHAAVNAMAKAKDVNDKHQVTEKTKTAAKLTMKQVARGVRSISKNMGGDM
jgi:hypothetical protein